MCAYDSFAAIDSYKRQVWATLDLYAQLLFGAFNLDCDGQLMVTSDCDLSNVKRWNSTCAVSAVTGLEGNGTPCATRSRTLILTTPLPLS